MYIMHSSIHRYNSDNRTPASIVVHIFRWVTSDLMRGRGQGAHILTPLTPDFNHHWLTSMRTLYHGGRGHCIPSLPPMRQHT